MDPNLAFKLKMSRLHEQWKEEDEEKSDSQSTDQGFAEAISMYQDDPRFQNEMQQFIRAVRADGSSKAIERAISDLKTNVVSLASGTKKDIEEALGAKEKDEEKTDEEEKKSLTYWVDCNSHIHLGAIVIRRVGNFLVIDEDNNSSAILVSTIKQFNVEEYLISFDVGGDQLSSFIYNTDYLEVKSSTYVTAIAILISKTHP